MFKMENRVERQQRPRTWMTGTYEVQAAMPCSKEPHPLVPPCPSHLYGYFPPLYHPCSTLGNIRISALTQDTFFEAVPLDKLYFPKGTMFIIGNYIPAQGTKTNSNTTNNVLKKPPPSTLYQRHPKPFY